MAIDVFAASGEDALDKFSLRLTLTALLVECGDEIRVPITFLNEAALSGRGLMFAVDRETQELVVSLTPPVQTTGEGSQ